MENRFTLRKDKMKLLTKHGLSALLSCCIVISWFSNLHAQWTVSELAPLPEPVSNHAVIATEVGGKPYVYTFSGIDSTKLFSGIHARCYKLDVQSNEWSRLPDLPGGKGRIAAAASELDGLIYVVGGYEVLGSGQERSLRAVHVFDPQTDTFLADAAPLIFPIDDHVQAVWRDSLLYVVTGWSNSANLFRNQLYNPQTDQWQEATPLPNNQSYKAFGASGCIIGDTIYYAGGATDGTLFPPADALRIGVINSENPMQISWSSRNDQKARGYRMAASNHNGNPVWLGGSLVTYNFDGIAYNGSGGVDPLGRILTFHTDGDSFKIEDMIFPPHMDFRGAGSIDEGTFILAGGMSDGQQVSDHVYLIKKESMSASSDHRSLSEFKLYPNPVSDRLYITSHQNIDKIVIRDMSGSVVQTIDNPTPVVECRIGSGGYIVEVWFDDKKYSVGKIIVVQ